MIVAIACTTSDDGGNVAVSGALAEQLRPRGHDVTLRVDHERPPLTGAGLLLVGHMAAVEALRAMLGSGRPAATIVRRMWSFVPASRSSSVATGRTTGTARRSDRDEATLRLAA